MTALANTKTRQANQHKWTPICLVGERWPTVYRYCVLSPNGEIVVPVEAALDLAPQKGKRRAR